MEILLSFINYLGIILGVFGVTAIQYLTINKENKEIVEKTYSFIHIGLFFTLIINFYRFTPTPVSYVIITCLFLIMFFTIIEGLKIVRVRFAQSFILTAWYYVLILTFIGGSQFEYKSLISVYFFLWFFVYLIIRALYFNVKENI